MWVPARSFLMLTAFVQNLRVEGYDSPCRVCHGGTKLIRLRFSRTLGNSRNALSALNQEHPRCGRTRRFPATEEPAERTSFAQPVEPFFCLFPDRISSFGVFSSRCRRANQPGLSAISSKSRRRSCLPQAPNPLQLRVLLCGYLARSAWPWSWRRWWRDCGISYGAVAKNAPRKLPKT